VGILAGIFAFSGGGPDVPTPTLSPLTFPEDEGVPAAEAGCRPVQTPPYQGHAELTPGQEHPPYNTDPPTSGWYLIVKPNAGFYGIPLPAERIMNIPADGGIVIWISESETRATRRFSFALHAADVLMTVWPGVEQGVVFTAWGVMQRCQKFSGEVAMAFIERYRLTALKQREPDYEPGSRPTSLPQESPNPSPSKL